jgi:MULE transposase domain
MQALEHGDSSGTNRERDVREQDRSDTLERGDNSGTNRERDNSEQERGDREQDESDTSDLEVDDWVQVWDWSSETTMDDFLALEPKMSIKKTNTVPCTLVHDHDSYLSIEKHSMKSRLTACKSARCHSEDDGVFCSARYKINACEKQPDVRVVYRQGNHILELRDDQPPISPRKSSLSLSMKQWIEDSLAGHPTAVPHKLRETIVLKIQAGIFPGEDTPSLAQVQTCVKAWRRHQPAYSGRVEAVEGRITHQVFDAATFNHIEETATVYLVDTDETDDGYRVRLGNGSVGNAFRLGVTCRKLFLKYLAVQHDHDSTTVLHLDSTFGVVSARYSFFAIGISDLRGGFHPFAYFCTSQRTASDISWCIGKLREVSLVCGAEFAPDWVMTDADDAQLNGLDVLNTPILMCWFHVTQNVEKKLKQFRVSVANSDQVWSDVYAMHFCRTHEEFEDTRNTVLARWHLLALTDQAMSRFVIHFEREWLHPGSRFWRWQVYHTPRGVATTNNPVEQYHGPLKRSLGLNQHTTVYGLVEAMERGMSLCTDSERFDFVKECEVSQRMNLRYKKLKSLGMLGATREPGNGNPCFRIRQLTFSEGITRFEQAGNLAATAELVKMGEKFKHKHECLNQPQAGWLVNTDRRDCACDLWFKHGVCVHVIHACTVDQKECPGVVQPKRRFVNPTTRVRRRSVRRRGNGRHQRNIEEPRRPRSPSLDM